MKKLKIALVMLLAMLMSIALFACGGSEDDEDDNKTVASIELYKTTVSFTDVDSADNWSAKANEIRARVYYTKGYSDINVGDCSVDLSGVKWGTVGSYTVEVTITENNPNKASASLEVIIEHDFHLREGSADTEVCSKDGATRVTKDLDVALNFQGFHSEGNYDLQPLDNGSIMPFGTAKTSSGNVEVRTTTVGRLEKGMTITLDGTAKNTNTDKAYYFPILGFADTSVGEYMSEAGTTYGTSIFVRNEGWVLLNGVGAPRMLAALAGGTTEGENYGSHKSDEGEKPDGYDVTTEGYGPSNWEDWLPWHVYSYGTISRSEAYVAGVSVRFSWSYLDIEQDGYGLIVLTYYMIDDNGNISSSLTCRAKVPDSPNGYYDSILHGEYVDMTFSKIQTIMTTTLKDIYYEGLEDGAKTEYLENEYLDFSALKVYRTTEQKPDYAQRERDTQFDVQAKLDGNWVSLKDTPLSQSMTEFKIVRISGTITKECKIEPSETVKFITIKKNAVDVAYGYPYAGTNVNGSIGEIAVSSAKLEDGKTYAKLTFANTAVASSDSDSGKKFVSFRIWAREGGTQFYGAEDTNNVAITSNGTPLVKDTDYKIAFGGSYVDVLIYLTADIKTNGVIISGIVPGTDAADVVVDLSEVTSISTVSEVSAYTVDLLAGGDVTVKYHIDDATWNSGANALSDMRVWVNAASSYFTEGGQGSFTGTVGGVKVVASTDTETKTVTVTYTLPGVSATNVVSYDLRLDFPVSGQQVAVATDTVYYSMGSLAADDTTENGIVKDGIYVTAQGSTLYLLKNFAGSDIREGTIKLDTANLSINIGTVESFNYLDLSYVYKNGEFAFTNASMSEIATGTLKVFGTLGNSYDYDNGAVAVIAVDLSKLSTLSTTVPAGTADGKPTVKPITAPYYFELNAESNPAYIYLVSADNKVSKQSVSLGESDVLIDGTCLETGYAGALYEGAAGDFYAGVSVIGGKHYVVDGVCTHCGAVVAADSVPAPSTWFGDPDKNPEAVAAYETKIADGEFIDFIATYSKDEDECGGEAAEMNAYAVVIYDSGVAEYAVNGHGLFNRWKEWWGEGSVPTSTVQEYLDNCATNGDKIDANMTSTLITEEHPYNTINGWIGSDGNPIDATSFNEARVGATHRFTVICENDSLSVRVRLYKAGVDLATGTPYYDFTCTLSNYKVSTADSVIFNGMQGFDYKNGTLTVIRGKILDSVLTGGSSSDDKITFGTPSVSGGYTNIAASGMATQSTEIAGYTHKAEFALDFSVALAQSTSVVVKDAEGEEVTGATATLAENGKKLNVLIPLTVDLASGTYTLELTNKEGYTLQRDIKVSLANVAVSDIEASVSENTLTLGGGSFKVTYTGNVADDMKLVVDGVEKVASAIAVGDTFGTLKVTSWSRNSGETVVVFQQTALDFTKEVKAHTVFVYTASDKLQAQNTIGFNKLLPATGVIEDAYVVADGTSLTFVFTQGVAAGSGKTFKLNANKGGTPADADLIRLYDLSFNVSANGTVSFENRNALNANATAVYSTIGDGIVAVTLDLANLQIGANDAYGIEAYIGATETAALYTVSAQKALSVYNAPSAPETVTLQEVGCEPTDGIVAKSDASKTFYYDIVITEGGHVFPANGGECTRCGDVTGWTKDFVVGTTANNSTTAVHGDGKAYWPSSDSAFSVIVPGQKITATGKYTASDSLGYVNMAGVLTVIGSVTDTITEGAVFRPDAWCDLLGEGTEISKYNWNVTRAWTYNGKENDNGIWSAYVAMRKEADAVITWDWSDPSKIVIYLEVTGIATGDVYTQTFTITPKGSSFTESKYAIGMQPWNGSFTGTLMATADKSVVSAEDCNQTKHQHTYGSNGICTGCGAVSPDHTHTFDPATHVCACGVVNPDASAHTFVNYICSVCHTVDVAALEAIATEEGSMTNNDTQAGWWNGGTSAVTMTDNFVVKVTYKNASKALPEAAAEMNVGTLFLDMRMDNTGNPSDVWTNPGDAAITRSVAHFGTQPAEGDWVGDYTVYFWRNGEAFGTLMQFTAGGSDSVTYSMLVHGTFPGAVGGTVSLVGDPYGLTDFTVKKGTISSAQ